MELCESIKTVCGEIVKNYNPEKIILYNIKRSVGGEIRSFKICVILETRDRHEMEKKIYLNVDSDIPFDVLVYTPAEWENLISEKSSFACRIIKGGTYIHG
jgi:acyl-ACP thioesterase